jgi:hypothetical protein
MSTEGNWEYATVLSVSGLPHVRISIYNYIPSYCMSVNYRGQRSSLSSVRVTVRPPHCRKSSDIAHGAINNHCPALLPSPKYVR